MPASGRQASPRLWIITGFVLLLVGALVLPPLININRYQRRIAASISRSIGRPVNMSSVKLRLLPLPGFELSDFSIEEDPRFGAEPILYAESVVAYPRLSSLWRGRFEVARIHFDNASLNLTRNAEGFWNFGSILLQAAQIPNAPTGQRYAGPAPRFPYIEASDSRINFKQGYEKKPLSFLNADLSVWLTDSDEWQLRFRAQPARTDLDLDLSDTGILRVDGALHRAKTLGEMPLRLNADWSAAPLGQLTHLILGRDSGWRGGLDIQARVDGTASAAKIQTVFKVTGLHRAEFTPVQPLDLAAACKATYRKELGALERILCTSSAGGGRIRLTGSVVEPAILGRASVFPSAPPAPAATLSETARVRPPSPTSPGSPLEEGVRLNLDLHHLPASAILSALQEVRAGIGTNLSPSGTLDGEFHFSSASGEPPSFTGKANMAVLSLTPAEYGRPFALKSLRLLCESPRAASLGGSPPEKLPALVLQPVELPLGADSPLTIDGRFTLAGFDLHLNGPMTLARLTALSQNSGILNNAIPALASSGEAGSFAAAGLATLNLDLRGPWLLPVPNSDNPVRSTLAEGSVALKNVEWSTSYLPQPVKILSAQALLGPSRITWTDATIGYRGIDAHGSLEYPWNCAQQPGCSAQFQLSMANLDLAALQSSLLGGANHDELLHEIFDRIGHHAPSWPRLSGTIEATTLTAGKLAMHDAVGTVAIAGSSMKILSLNGRLWNGSAHLTGQLDAGGDRPQYRLDFQVTDASPAAGAAAFAERWGSGSADLSAQLQMSGFDARQLSESASGSFHWDWRKGSLAPEGPAADLSRFDHWSGDAVVGSGILRIGHSLFARGSQAIPLDGHVTFDGEIDLHSGSETHPLSITGTFQRLRVEGAPTS